MLFSSTGETSFSPDVDLWQDLCLMVKIDWKNGVLSKDEKKIFHDLCFSDN